MFQLRIFQEIKNSDTSQLFSLTLHCTELVDVIDLYKWVFGKRFSIGPFYLIPGDPDNRYL